MDFRSDAKAFLDSWSNIAGLLCSLWVLYGISIVTYRLILHPLADFPGPKLAAITYWYEFYYDVIKWGQVTNQIQALHQQYGPIVRIGPDELHCNDIKFADEIYAGGGRIRNKYRKDIATWPSMSQMSSFGTLDHHHHKLRRGAINKYFSTAQIERLEPRVQNLVQKLCDRILETKGPFDIACAYSCFSVDVITDYCFDGCKGFLDQKSWHPNFREPVHAMMAMFNVLRQFPSLNIVGEIMPPWLMEKLDPNTAYLLEEINVRYPALVRQTMDNHTAGIRPRRTTVLDDMLDPSLLEAERSHSRLHAEMQSLQGAGAETTSWVLAVGTFHLLDKPQTLTALTTELRNIVKDTTTAGSSSGEFEIPAWHVLQELPYLTGIVREATRLAYGPLIRSFRIAPDEDLIYPPVRLDEKRGATYAAGADRTFVIPKGTPIAMTNRLMNIDPTIFDDAESFDPQRWIKNGQRNRELEALFQPFGRGSRRCVGMNLAHCELYCAFATLALRVFPRLALYETTIDDIKYHHDEFVSAPVPGSKGVRVVVLDPK